MANLIDTINSSVSKATGSTGNNTNYGIKKRAPVVPVQTTPGPMSVNTAPASNNIVKSNIVKTPTVPTAPITSDALKTSVPIKLPDAKVDNTPTDLTNKVTVDTTSSIDTYTNDLQKVKDSYGNGNDIANLMKSISGIQNSEDTQAKALGSDTNLAEYNRLSSALDLEKNTARKQIEDIQKSNPTGALRGGQLDQIANIERDSARKQGDLAFEANARLGAYDKAVSIAKKQVEMEVAPMKAELERLQYLQDFNKEFRTAEIDAIKLKKQNEIKREEDRLTKGNDMIINALSQGASVSATSKAKELLSQGKSILEVASSLGKYAGDYLGNEIKKSTIAKNYADANKAQKELADLNIDPSTLPNTTTGFITKLASSAKNTKELDATERQSLSKARTVIGQLDSLQKNIAGQQGTGLIKGKVTNLFEKFGANADVGVINAQLQAIVPNLARGTYGEVGVLTDNDIENYRKTLPRLDRPQDQNDAVMALTLKTVLNSMENTLSGAANSGINVSGWTQDYIKIKNQINTVEDRIGVSKEAVNTLVASDPTLLPAVKEMYQNGLTDREILEAVNAD